ncbi:MAG: type II toxin-antitoxin system prevent-host-death family antitoxin [Sulfuritalea sp.]|jgi:antitoxin (DNA-binding transcriptional repressor) of toxin-antitoxin stability system|nr:type II toxin-antitoxin system prevent-host-death family antitoxin [Sulfuritalea sp.]
MQFNMGDARKHWAYLVAAVERGEEVILARNGKPVAKIVRDETPNNDQGGELMGDWNLCRAKQLPKPIKPLE